MTFNNDWPEGRTAQERRFLARLSELQPPYCDVWGGRPELIVTVDVVDEEQKSVLRTLRVDFDGRRIVPARSRRMRPDGDRSVNIPGAPSIAKLFNDVVQV